MNPNDRVKVKPTKSGWQEIIAYVNAWNESIKHRYDYQMRMPTTDKDGYITGQFWSLMVYFDWKKTTGSELPFSDMQLIVEPTYTAYLCLWTDKISNAVTGIGIYSAPPESLTCHSNVLPSVLLTIEAESYEAARNKIISIIEALPADHHTKTMAVRLGLITGKA